MNEAELIGGELKLDDSFFCRVVVSQRHNAEGSLLDNEMFENLCLRSVQVARQTCSGSQFPSKAWTYSIGIDPLSLPTYGKFLSKRRNTSLELGGQSKLSQLRLDGTSKSLCGL